ESGDEPQHHRPQELEHGEREAEALVEVPVTPRAAEDVEGERLHPAHDEVGVPARRGRPRHSGGVSEAVKKAQDRGDAEEPARGHREAPPMAAGLNRRFYCGVELALEILQGKWKPVILAHLKESPMRYAQLRAAIPGLSDKMLSQRLRDLEE